MSDASSPPPPQPTVQQTFAAYSGPPLDTIRSIVSTQFQVRDAFLDPNGVPTFLVDADATKDKFMHLVEQLRPQRLIAAIRGTADTLTIKVFQKPHVKQSRRTINVGLFLATVVSVTVAGYFLWMGGLGPQTLEAQYNEVILPGARPYLEAGVLAIGHLARIWLREL